jgi:hypothetical protein
VSILALFCVCNGGRKKMLQHLIEQMQGTRKKNLSANFTLEKEEEWQRIQGSLK